MENGEKEFNRWVIVVGGVLIQLALGSIYAFSIFTSPLADVIYENKKLGTNIDILGIFAAVLVTFAATMIFAGRLQDRKGPMFVATLGGIFYGLGHILAGYLFSYITPPSLFGIYLSYSIIGGIGVGLGYVCPIAAAVKWFPDKKGLVTGIAVAGFGAGAFIFAQVGNYIINGFSWGLPSRYESSCIANTFLILGTIFFTMVVAGARFLRNPPEGWRPRGWNPTTTQRTTALKKDYGANEIVKTPQFWLLWMMFALSATAGLMMIGNVKNVANYLADGNTAMLVVSQAALIAGILALFNGLGRIVWGSASDKLGRTKTMRLMFTVQALLLFGMAVVCALKPANNTVQFIFLTILASLVGFLFGGNFAIFPSSTSDFFGNKNIGINYGLVFTSYGVAGVLGAIIPASLAKAGGSFVWVFAIIGVASLVATGLSFIIKTPRA